MADVTDGLKAWQSASIILDSNVPALSFHQSGVGAMTLYYDHGSLFVIDSGHTIYKVNMTKQ